MVNSKHKGNQGEIKFSKWLREYNVSKVATRTPMSGGSIFKSDVSNDIDINFEVKTCKAINIKKAYNQSEKDAEKSHTTPYVVVHLDGMPDNTWYIIMNNWDWLDLWRKAQKPKNLVKTESRESQWLIRQGIEVLKKILKYLEGK